MRLGPQRTDTDTDTETKGRDMKGHAAALALVLAIGSTAGCAELTTTGVPADGSSAESGAMTEGHGGSSPEVEDPNAASAEILSFAEGLVGMDTAEAQAATEEAGYTYRVGEIDGEPQAATLDYRLDRINVSLEDDVVTAVTIG